jgi:hypothetical protein
MEYWNTGVLGEELFRKLVTWEIENHLNDYPKIRFL